MYEYKNTYAYVYVYMYMYTYIHTCIYTDTYMIGSYQVSGSPLDKMG